MKSILITGATGFLGKHLVKKLMRADPESRLRALCRGASSWDHDPRVEVVHGDITSAEDVQRAAEGASEIYHLAGIVSRDAKDAPLLYRTHIEGTRNVCEAARRHDAAKVVIASTSGVMAVSRDATVHRETGSYKHEVVGEWPYYLSKILAEKLALDYFERYQQPVTCVNPSLILGPGDDRNSSTRDVALFLRGQIMAIPEGGLNFVDVRDVALALIAAMRQGKPGERYLVGGQNWSFGEFLVALAMVSGGGRRNFARPCACRSRARTCCGCSCRLSASRSSSTTPRSKCRRCSGTATRARLAPNLVSKRVIQWRPCGIRSRTCGSAKWHKDWRDDCGKG
ncbi:MAG: NAD-dependent epimerase/dehydratase family protein [Terriglobia bacterium]